MFWLFLGDLVFIFALLNELQRQKTNLRTCLPSEDSDQPTHLRSLIKIITGHILDSQGFRVSSCETLIRMRHAQADLSIR